MIAVGTAADTVDALLARADSAMYQAKQAGRDRVCCANAACIDIA